MKKKIIHLQNKKIIRKKFKSSLPYLYNTRGISKKNILAYIGVRIYMGIYKLPSFLHYWNCCYIKQK